MKQNKDSEIYDIWDNLPREYRKKLLPYRTQLKINQTIRLREVAVINHAMHLKEIDNQIEELQEILEGHKKNSKHLLDT